MTRYLGPERLITPGDWGGSLYKEGRQKESKPVNDNIYQALEDGDSKFILEHPLERFYSQKVLYAVDSNQ